MKFCKDCKFCDVAPFYEGEMDPDAEFYDCHNPKFCTSAVTGKVIGYSCVKAREFKGNCGQEGIYWEAKDASVIR